MNNRNRTIIVISSLVVIAATGIVAFKMTMQRNMSARDSSVTGAYSTSLGLSAGEMGVAPFAPSERVADYYVADKSMPYPSPSPEPTAGETAAEVDQKIIKNGSLHMVVDDVSGTADDLTALAKAKGGFVQSSQVSERGDGTHSGFVSIRVPVVEFENAMNAAKALARTVKSDSATGQDVTEQYTDLRAQLRNAKAQEEVYLQVLKQAKTVQDILSVQQYLGQIRGQIESLEGRSKYLENQTSFSTIGIQLEEEPAVRLPTKEFRPTGAAKEAIQALVELAQNLAITLIWLVIVGGGIAIPLALLIWLVAALVRRLARPRK